MKYALKNCFRQFSSKEDGSATVEACLWLPVLMLFFMLVLDATYMFVSEGEVWRVLTEANRQYVRGGLGDTTADLELFLETKLARFSPNIDAVSVVDANGILTTTVTLPARDTTITGVFPQFINLDLTVRAVHQTEV